MSERGSNSSGKQSISEHSVGVDWLAAEGLWCDCTSRRYYRAIEENINSWLLTLQVSSLSLPRNCLRSNRMIEQLLEVEAQEVVNGFWQRHNYFPLLFLMYERREENKVHFNFKSWRQQRCEMRGERCKTRVIRSKGKEFKTFIKK